MNLNGHYGHIGCLLSLERKIETKSAHPDRSEWAHKWAQWAENAALRCDFFELFLGDAHRQVHLPIGLPIGKYTSRHFVGYCCNHIQPNLPQFIRGRSLSFDLDILASSVIGNVSVLL